MGKKYGETETEIDVYARVDWERMRGVKRVTDWNVQWHNHTRMYADR